MCTKKIDPACKQRGLFIKTIRAYFSTRKEKKQMSYFRTCKVCGCSLDPGEGYICEDCQKEQEKRIEQMKILQQNMIEEFNGQLLMVV